MSIFTDDVLINLLLIVNDVRPAMLIQPADYREATGSDTKTKTILMNIKKEYPTLIHSENYKGDYQGILISKKSFDDEEINLNKMGEILGYPCADDYGKIDQDEISYGIDLIAIYDNGSQTVIFSNVCKNNSSINEFEKIAENATNVLKGQEINRQIVEKVIAEIYSIIPTKLIVKKVVQNIPLNKEETDKILNILYNFGFGMELQFIYKDDFQYDNDLHKGILLALLLYELNDPIKPFTPLQQYPEEDKKFDEITSKWEMGIIELILSTKENKNIIRKPAKAGFLISEGRVLSRPSDTFDKEETEKVLENIGFSRSCETFGFTGTQQVAVKPLVSRQPCSRSLSNFIDGNQIKKGILLLLLTYGKNNPLSPFDKYPEIYNKSLVRIKKWEEDLLNIVKSKGGRKSLKKKNSKYKKKKRTIRKKK